MQDQSFEHNTPPVVLTIAGSDSSGGAGIGVDLKTFRHFGLHGAMVVTALTAQNSTELRAIHPVPAGMVGAQLRAVFDDLPVKGIKIGMVPTIEIIEVIAEALGDFDCEIVVLDTPLSSSTGVQLVESGVAGAMVDHLFPLASLITPNLDEAAFILGEPVAQSTPEMASQGRALAKLSNGAILVKGGHGTGDQAVDVLINGQMAHELAAKKLITRNNRGTGCALSSAIVSHLIQGHSIYDSVWESKKWLTEVLMQSSAISLGSGAGPLKI